MNNTELTKMLPISKQNKRKEPTVLIVLGAEDMYQMVTIEDEYIYDRK